MDFTASVRKNTRNGVHTDKMNKKLYFPSVLSRRLLCSALPFLCLCLIWLMISVISCTDTSPDVITHTYTPALEHIMISLTLLILGALLLDISEKELRIKRGD